jgi:hypothetical protein
MHPSIEFSASPCSILPGIVANWPGLAVLGLLPINCRSALRHRCEARPPICWNSARALAALRITLLRSEIVSVRSAPQFFPYGVPMLNPLFDSGDVEFPARARSGAAAVRVNGSNAVFLAGEYGLPICCRGEHVSQAELSIDDLPDCYTYAPSWVIRDSGIFTS